MPTRNTPWPAGTPCWIDYGASEIDAAKDFYGRLFGWEFEGGDPDYGGFLNAPRNGEPAAGLGPLMNPADSPGWTTYFATDDAAATAARIREAGGTVVVEPMEVGDRKSTRLNSSHANISYAVFCLKKKKINTTRQ